MSEENKPEAAKPVKAAVTKKPATKAAAVQKRAPAKKTTARKPAAAKAATAKRTAPKKAPATPKPAVAKTAEKTAAAAAKVSETAQKTAPEAETSANHAHSKAANDGPEATAAFNKDKLIEELKEKDWATIVIRGIFMLVFGMLCQIALSFTFFLAVIQFIVMVGTGKPNHTITGAIAIAGKYMGQVLNFLSFKTEDKPFPFDLDFPQNK